MFKKVLAIIVLVMGLVVFSSPPTALASCNLDTTRWHWVGSTDDYGLFVDAKTVRPLYGNIVESWVCKYNVGSCELHRIGEHYDFCLITINYNNNTAGLKFYYVLDSNDNYVERYDYKHFTRYEPILPGSDGEFIADAVYLLAYGRKR